MYWLFKCNPEKYRIDERLKDPESTITWRVTRYKDEIEPGDIAFIWRTGRDRGICAVMQIDSAPQDMPELDHELQYCVDLDTGIKCRVVGTLIERVGCFSHNVLRWVPGLENMAVFHGFQQATNFQVTPEEGEKLIELIQEMLEETES